MKDILKELWHSISAKYCEVVKSVVFIAVVMLCVIMCSCSTVQYVPVESVRVDSVYTNKVQRDSVYVQDSVFIRERGDTVFVNKYKKLYIERLSHDTIRVVKIDSIACPYLVEKELNFYQKNCMKIGEMTLWVFIFIFISFAVWLAYKAFH